MMPGSANRRAVSSGPNSATRSTPKPAKAARMVARRFSTISHDSPACMISRHKRSNSTVSSRDGKPCSVA